MSELGHHRRLSDELRKAAEICLSGKKNSAERRDGFSSTMTVNAMLAKVNAAWVCGSGWAQKVANDCGALADLPHLMGGLW